MLTTRLAATAARRSRSLDRSSTSSPPPALCRQLAAPTQQAVCSKLRRLAAVRRSQQAVDDSSCAGFLAWARTAARDPAMECSRLAGCLRGARPAAASA